MIEFTTPYLSTFVRSTLFRGPRIIAARMHDFLSLLAGDLNLATNRILLRRMTIADFIHMTGTDEVTLASVNLPAGVLRDGDQINLSLVGDLNTDSGAAEFVLRVYIRNEGGTQAVFTYTGTPESQANFRMDVTGILIPGTPFGPGEGPDTASAYGSVVFNNAQPYISGHTPTDIDLSLPISIEITAQVDQDDGSKVEAFGWQIDMQRATIHPDAF